MSGSAPTALPHRGSTRIETRGAQAALADHVAFAETLIREVDPGAVVTSATIQILAPAVAGRITGEAQCLSAQVAPVWRVFLRDEAGTLLTEVTLTLSAGAARPAAAPAAPVVAPVPRSGPEDRRARIALAAQEVFADKGYAAATMREVAAAAGMHVPTIYQYVRSKEEILELVYGWTIDRAVAGMEDVLSAKGPAPERIDAIVRCLHEVNAGLRRGTLVMNRETRSLSRDARERVLGRYAAMVRRIGDVVAQGQADGVFRPMNPQLAAVFIDSLADVWVLRPFAVGGISEDDYTASLAAFVRGALMGDTANNPDTPGDPETIRRE